MCLKPRGRRGIFQPGWTGDGRRALLRSMLGSTNNVPSTPSLQSMASSVTASIAHIERAGCSLGVFSRMERGPLIQVGDRHFPFPCKGPGGCEGTDLPRASLLQEGRGVQGTGAARHSRGSKDLLPRAHCVSPDCCSSGEGRRSTDHQG